VGLLDEVRATCRRIADGARSVRIHLNGLGAVEAEAAAEAPPGYSPPPSADYWLMLDAINFGSGWFPTLRKRPGCSGYFTIAWALADRFHACGPWSPAELRSLDPRTVAGVLGQEPDHELMALYAQALRHLGSFLGDRAPLDAVADAGGSAERLAETLAAGMPFFRDRGFYKRAQIAPSDLALAGVAGFTDLDRLTIFADNLVPHVLRVDGVLRYEPALAGRIDAGEPLAAGSREEVEIRACALHACELIAPRLGVAPRLLDMWLWNRGQGERYRARPRHRCRCTWY
jgi:Potential Queuosine, Q, salvage protein family